MAWSRPRPCSRSLVDNAEQIFDALDDEFLVSDQYGDNTELGAQNSVLEAFMSAQTDPAALDMRHLTPASVPSGLPVED